MVLLDLVDPVEREVNLDLMDHLDHLDLLDLEESLDSLVHQDHEEILENKDHLDLADLLGLVVRGVNKDLLDLPDPQDNLVTLYFVLIIPSWCDLYNLFANKIRFKNSVLELINYIVLFHRTCWTKRRTWTPW